MPTYGNNLKCSRLSVLIIIWIWFVFKGLIRIRSKNRNKSTKLHCKIDYWTCIVCTVPQHYVLYVHCTVENCAVHCTVENWTVHCICIAEYCTLLDVLYCTVESCTVPFLYCRKLFWTERRILYCTLESVLNCT
jgi:hypothetical protein